MLLPMLWLAEPKNCKPHTIVHFMVCAPPVGRGCPKVSGDEQDKRSRNLIIATCLVRPQVQVPRNSRKETNTIRMRSDAVTISCRHTRRKHTSHDADETTTNLMRPHLRQPGKTGQADKYGCRGARRVQHPPTPCGACQAREHSQVGAIPSTSASS